MKLSDYITVKAAAAHWGVSTRYVTQCLAAGRVPGAVKRGRQWLLPRDARKPSGHAMPASALAQQLRDLSDLTSQPMPRDNPDAILGTLTEPRVRLQYEGELAYLRGDFERVVACFAALEHDDAAKLRACPLTIAAAISTGNYTLYTTIEAYLKTLIAAPNDPVVSAVAELALNTAYVSAIAPNMVSPWLKEGDFAALPPPAWPDAAYKRAKYFQGLGRYESMLAVAQTALAFCTTGQGILYPELYLRVTCAAACCGLQRETQAEQYLSDALAIALPHGFVTPFAESAVAFGGLLERCLERQYPDQLDVVARNWRHTVANWMRFHNRFTKDNITSILSLRQYEIASLAAHHVPRAEIARRFHISEGRLNNILQEIYAKLLVSGRDELLQFIL